MALPVRKERVKQLGRGIARLYRGTALVLLNLIVLLVLLNVALGVYYAIKDQRAAANRLPLGSKEEWLAQLYPHCRREQVGEFWRQFEMPLTYEPFTEFKESPRSGEWVNVDAHGFRPVKDQAPWPPDAAQVNIFVFGGSTTFGYGVPDDRTWPSQLQEIMRQKSQRVCIYNFGRGYYYSVQERILLEQLLMAGHVPRMAIFFDGLNDCCFDKDETASSARFTQALPGPQGPAGPSWLSLALAELPIGRGLRSLRAEFEPAASAGDDERYRDKSVIRHILRRYRENQKLIESACAVYQVTPVFVWQPVPSYRYDRELHPYAAHGFGVHARAGHAYPMLAEQLRDAPAKNHFVWLADIQEGAEEPLYLDLVHYSPGFHRRIAEAVDQELHQRGLLQGGSK